MRISEGLKINVLIDHEENLAEGRSEASSVRSLSRDWELTPQEVIEIIRENEAFFQEGEQGEFI